MHNDALHRWLAALEKRHLADLTFAEVSRALRALSSTYVERRSRIREGAALSGTGKRAAFALFYAPLHFMLVERIVASIPAAAAARGTIVDLGCGTGAAAAAWAARSRSIRKIIGIDRHAWALQEAAHTYREFGLPAQVRRADVATMALPKGPVSFVAAFTMNELPDAAREVLLSCLLDRARRGDRLLVVEPLARSIAPWWAIWSEAVIAAGGRADEWRFEAELPPIVAKLDRAAGLDHRELTGRSLWLGGQP